MPARRYIIAAALLICASTAFAQSAAQVASKPSALAGGVRQYTGHPEDDNSPFGDGDMSYLFAYEYHEGAAYWQFGISYTPDATSTSLVQGVESVITPQLRLVFEQGPLVLGGGILKHYVRQENSNHWSEVYWEVELGLHLPVSAAVDLRALAYYTFKKLGELRDLDTSQIEYGLEISYRF